LGWPKVKGRRKGFQIYFQQDMGRLNPKIRPQVEAHQTRVYLGKIFRDKNFMDKI